jgi:4-amino-4-deoxy-L-arabinose transferase-like glycosyltransferase
VALLLLAAGLAVGTRFPPQEIVGDEPFYVQAAHRHPTLAERLLELVPGAMPFYWWPPFAPAVYALCADPEVTAGFAAGTPASPSIQLRPLSPALRRFLASIARLNAVLLAVSGVLLYALTLHLGAGRAAAAAAGLGLGLSPRILYYVIALWPELLHVTVVAGALLCLTAGARSNAPVWHLAGGAALGVASLIKPAAEVFALLLVSLGIVELSLRREARRRACFSILLFAIGFCAVNLPQRTANALRHERFAVSANHWVNLEAGLLPDFTYRQYFGPEAPRSYDGTAYLTLEQDSRRRVLDFLGRAALDEVLRRSTLRLFEVQLSQSFLARDLEIGRRWSEPPPATAVRIGAALSWLAFLLGLPGALVLGVLDRRARPLALYVGFQLPLLLLGGFNPRFFVQAYPALCVAGVNGIARAVRRLRSKGA